MKLVTDLELGFLDAENYRRRENREIFNQLFLRTPELDRLCEPSTFFLIGEKGTGKTAYAVYLSNVGYKDTLASTKYIRETEYLKFVSLKKEKFLSLSDYVSIWKVIVYVLLAHQIKEKEPSLVSKGISLFSGLDKAINEFYRNAFSPEIQTAIQFAEEAEVAAKLIAQYIEFGGNANKSKTYSETRFQINLFYIQRQFENVFKSLKLSVSQILFIDGIDIRPPTVDYETYLDCIKGLANAVWEINNDFFANIKDSKGRIKVVLLVRPDIFNSLSLQNMNSKVSDNSVILNWITTYTNFRNSPLFHLADRLLAYQQEREYPPGTVWNYYFPYNASNVTARVETPSSFIQFLRYCLNSPRNILAILSIQKEIFVEQGRKPHEVFKLEGFKDPAFTRKYSDYILGEVKDKISFFYNSIDYENLLKFFQYLDGKSVFTYKQYLEAYENFMRFLKRNKFTIPAFCDTPDILLQFLYDLSILGSIVETKDPKRKYFYNWCNRDRSPSNIAPKVRTHATYEIHYGLMRALNLGMLFRIGDDTEWDNSFTE